MALALVEQIERSNRGAGLAECSEQPQETFLMQGNIVGVIALGIGIEIDLQPAAVATVVDLDRKIFDRTEGKIPDLGAMPGKAEVVVEPHDIQIETEQRAAIIDIADFPAQVGDLKALVVQAAPDFRRSRDDGVGHGHPGIDRQPQRQHVRYHAGRVACGAAAGRDRQPEYDVFFTRHAVQVDCSGGGEEMRQTGACPVRSPFEFFLLCAGHECRTAEEAIELPSPRTAQAHPLRTISQMVEPVLPIARKLLGRAIIDIRLEHFGEGTERAPQCCRSDAELGVDGSKTSCHQGHAKPVHDDMVIARVPEETVG